MVGVRIDNVTKSFGNVEVLKDIDISIAPGELFFLLGPSGCGKTTLLRIIAGFIEPSSGSVHFDDRDITNDPPEARNTGMVFQNYALWPHMTVAQNVAFGLDVRKIDRAEKNQRVSAALELVHLPSYEGRYPHQLSGGQQQRVALARALVIRPDVVLLDEPLSNLDAGLRIEMRKEIHRIHAELGITMIYVTHDQKEALSLATRMAVLEGGVIVQIDTPTEIYQNPDSVFVARFVGETNLVAGTCSRAAGGQVVLDTPAGALHVSASRCVVTPSAGQPVAISIRPEGIALVPQQTAAANLWRATVVESIYLGEIVQVLCDAAGVKLRLTVLNPAGQPPAAGEECMLSFNPAHLRVLEQV
jgi:iron(III) transport system ATP-binding protein